MLTLVIVAATVTLTGYAQPQDKPLVVYHDGSRMLFATKATGTLRMATFGRWQLGERLQDEKLRDKRLNLYVVFPGRQYRSLLHSQYNHTLVINKYTVDAQPREWDIFLCLVLDPRLRHDLRSEHELLVAAHQRFRIANDFKFRRIPSHTVLKEKLGITSVNDLQAFYQKDRSFPRLLIVPANLALRATTTKAEQN
jgi:hypothetical protein